MRAARAVAVACAILGGVVSATARADPAPDTLGARRTVVVDIQGSDDGGLLDATIRELLDRRGLAVVRPSAREPSGILARVTVDRPAVGPAHVTIIDARDQRVVVQADIARDSGPAIAREAIAHAVQSAVESLLLGVEARASSSTGLAPPQASPVAPAPTPAPAPPVTGAAATPAPSAPAPASPPTSSSSSPSRDASSPDRARASPRSISLDVAMLGGAGPIATGSGLVPRLGAAATLAAASALRPSLTISAAYALPFRHETPLVSTQTSFVAFRVLPSIAIARGSSFAVELAVGGGIDLVTVEPRSDALPASTIGRTTTRVDALATSMIFGRFALTSSLAFVAGAGVDVDLYTRDYVIRQGPVETALFAPWRVRPALMMGLAFTAVGPSPFIETEGRQ